jgi:BMFP domain-containing protein YqiC
MQTSNRFLDDLARVANSAFGAAAGLRNEVEAMVRDRLQRMTADMDLVSREEFEAVREMAARARSEQDALLARIQTLEQTIAELRRRSDPAPPTE